jgi:hypothetical protein
MQGMVICLGADFECNQLVIRCAWRRLASRNEIGSWSADGVLHKVGNEKREQKGNEPSQDCYVRFVTAGPEDESPYDEGAEWYCACVDKEPCCEYVSFQSPWHVEKGGTY